MKEQVAKKHWLIIRDFSAFTDTLEWEDLPKDEQIKSLEWAQEILNLFKAEVDKLTVIDDRENYWIRYSQYPQDSWDLKAWLTDRDNFTYNSIKQFQEAQLQHTKEQLLDLMEE